MKIRKVVELLLLLIPTMLLFAGQANTVAQWLIDTFSPQNTVNVNTLKDWLLGIGTVISGIVLPVRIIELETRRDTNHKALDKMLTLWQEVFTDLLRTTAKNHALLVNIRVCRPKKWYEKKFQDYREGRLEFVVNSIAGIVNKDDADGLCFEVKPVPQGVIGQVYQTNSTVYDVNVQQGTTNYNLTPFQKQQLRRTKFVVGVPIVDKNNRIIYIVSIDSQDALAGLSPVQEQKLVEIVFNYLSLTEELILSLIRKRIK